MTESPLTPKDRVYRLKTGSPLSYMLPSRNTANFPLLYYDEEKNINRALRYCTNQRSPFEDEQDSNPILSPVIFEDGNLYVPKTNPVLQLFLHYHPFKNAIFEEVNHEKEAEKQMEQLNVEVDALLEAKSMPIEQMEMVYRVIFGKDPTSVTSPELKRDILIYAKQSPAEFLRFVHDPELNYQAKVRLFFEKGLLATRNNGKEVWFNTSASKRKMVSVPTDEDLYEYVGHYLRSDDGLDALKMLENITE